jgi:hypothetical protein
MRSDQYVGLNEWSQIWLYRYKREARILEIDISAEPPIILGVSDRTIIDIKTEIIGKIEGAWNDHVADLNRYTLPSGDVYEEYIQAEPWSSGPCYFIALKRNGEVVYKSLWTDEEIANA